MRRRLAAGLAAIVLVALPTVTTPPVASAATCTGWSSTLVPPPTIRVLRTYGAAAGTVQLVDFQSYVENVMFWEYVSTWPRETLRAGAVAIKEYGWYYVMHYRGGTAGGGCYDVQDNTNDQMYRPETGSTTATEVAAVHDTWGVSVTRNGAQFLTGYWSGNQVACGSDADGIRIYQWSSADCGNQGRTFEEILKLYYGAGVDVSIPTNAPLATFFSVPAGTQVTSGSSPTIDWREETPAGAGIASRSLTLVRASAANGSCPASGWLPAAATFANAGASPQAFANLQPGSCYWLFVTLTDANGLSAVSRSGAFLVDPQAPAATFTSPVARVTAGSGAGTISWIEGPVPGTTIVSRLLTEENAWAPWPGTCAGARWQVAWQRAVATPYSVTGMRALTCYRFRLALTDSTGHMGTAYSGEFVTP